MRNRSEECMVQKVQSVQRQCTRLDAGLGDSTNNASYPSTITPTWNPNPHYIALMPCF